MSGGVIDFTAGSWWGYLVIACAIVILLNLRNYYFIFPHIAACLGWWRGNFMLESSVSLQRVRNICAATTLLPVAMVVYHYGLAPLAYAGGYLAVRLVPAVLITPDKKYAQTWEVARRCIRNYFIPYGMLLVLTVGICVLLRVSDDVTKFVLLGETAFSYVVFFRRKRQIFKSAFGGFTVFLYLCALEIIPTGLLIAVTILF